jgi:HPt (histidine-containing phosphotransfer) domain-containing protein
MLDQEAVNELRMVMGEGFTALIDAFETDSHRRLASLRAALASADGDAAREAAHSLKGSSLNIGARVLAAAALAAEQAAREDRLDEVAALLGDIEAALAAVLPALRAAAR